MQAVTVPVPGPHAPLAVVSRPIPQPGPGEVLIRVHYTALNRADIFQRQGSYAPPEGVTDVPGLEVSGKIADVGPGESRWRIGDAVCALLPGGGYAQYAVAKAVHCLPLPVEGDFASAAALPECVTTVWMTVFAEAMLQPGERLLVHGGASGIGTTAIQMARAQGCEVFTTAGTSEKCALCEQLGAKAILYNEQDFSTIVKEAGGVDVVLDMVGGDYISKNIKALRQGGRMVSIAFLKGNQMELNAAGLLMKQLRWTGMTLRNRSDEEKAQYISHIANQIWPWVAEGWVRPVIDSVYPLRHAAEAQERMEKYLHCGKILLQVTD